MISLTSQWELLEGCPPELKCELDRLADKVKQAELDTWMYLVHLQAPDLLGTDGNPIEPPPPPIPLSQQTTVTFIEVYANAQAFSRHVKGEVFQTFLKDYGKYFKQDPDNPGWPITHNGYYTRASGFIRHQAE